jgi:hypothetical protein
MKNIINSLQNISHKLLLILNLDRSIWHQQWVRYCDLNSFNLSISSTASPLILILIVSILASIEICFFRWWNWSPLLSTVFEIKVVHIVLLVWIGVTILGLLGVVVETYIAGVYYFLIWWKYVWIVCLHVYV